MKKVILFDFDGTIADSFDNFLEIVRVLSDKHNLPKLSDTEMEELRSEDARSILKKLKIPFYKIPQLGRDMKTLQAESLTKIQVFKDLPAVLHDLKNEGYKLGIVTSNGEENVRNFLKNNDIDIFEFIQSDSSLFGKDRVIKKVLSQRGYTRDEAIYIGDEIRDIQACKSAGVRIIAVTWGFNSKAGLEKNNPDFLAQKPQDLTTIILSQTS